MLPSLFREIQRPEGIQPSFSSIGDKFIIASGGDLELNVELFAREGRVDAVVAKGELKVKFAGNNNHVIVYKAGACPILLKGDILDLGNYGSY